MKESKGESAGEPKRETKGLSLFSGGLDSILATRLVMEQGLEVEAVQFVTPFFHYDILGDIPGHRARVFEKYGITVHVEDISEGYLQLLHNPQHGFGKNFNPCIDCKILMFSRARELLGERGASFLISGEVLGQRPMSQRRDTLNLIERDSGTRSILLRPLSARLMKETEPELRGWVDRSRLLGMSGRGRSAQIALAAHYGIRDYPAPAGGCILADPLLSRRIKRLYREDSEDAVIRQARVEVHDVRQLLVGRQFMLPGGGWLILGRDEKDNGRLLEMLRTGDGLLLMEQWPGPVALLKKVAHYKSEESRQRDIAIAASLVVRYGRKLPPGVTSREVSLSVDTERSVVIAEPIEGEEFRDWVLR